jgi:hypothetical protein
MKIYAVTVLPEAVEQFHEIILYIRASLKTLFLPPQPLSFSKGEG